MKNLYILLVLVAANIDCAQNTNTLTENNATNTNSIHMKYIDIINDGKEVAVRLIVPGSSSAKCQIEDVPAKAITYKKGTITNSFLIIHDPNTKKDYSFPYSEPSSFYISYDSGLIVCALGSGADVWWFESCFEITKKEKIEAVVARFISLLGDDDKISNFYRNIPRVNLRDAANQFFFSANSNYSMPAIPKIKAINVTDDILRLDLVSDGGKFEGSFWINLKLKNIVKSIVKSVQDGKQVYPIPLFKKF